MLDDIACSVLSDTAKHSSVDGDSTEASSTAGVASRFGYDVAPEASTPRLSADPPPHMQAEYPPFGMHTARSPAYALNVRSTCALT